MIGRSMMSMLTLKRDALAFGPQLGDQKRRKVQGQLNLRSSVLGQKIEQDCCVAEAAVSKESSNFA